jgi:hypothetical protein
MITIIVGVFVFWGLAAAGLIPGITPGRTVFDDLPNGCPLFPPDELDILC